MNLREEIFDSYKKLIEASFEENKHGALALKANMERSPMYYKDDYRAKTLQIPKVYTKEDVKLFSDAVETAYDIFTKVIERYLSDESYRRLFAFPRELEELILASAPKKASLLPIARFDIFYHEDTGNFGFCEINTDGTSAMNEDRMLRKLFLDNPAHQEIIRRYRLYGFELFETWIDCFLSLYKKERGTDSLPNIAIVDFLEGGTLREFQEFAIRFQRRGLNCEICDVSEFTYKDGRLISPRGHRIDAIYRRAVTSDLLKRPADSKAMLSAIKDGAVMSIGSIQTQIIHNKRLFFILRDEMTSSFLSEKERAFVEKHIPRTVPFNSNYINIEDVLSNKDKYILKPEDSYASNGVYAGVEFSDEKWETLVKGAFESDYLCQDYYPQYHTENIDFAWGDGAFKPYINMAGLYVYDGHFAGVYSRMAEGSGIIASHRNERTVPTFIADGKKEPEELPQ